MFEKEVEELVKTHLLDKHGNPVVTLQEFLTLCVKAYDPTVKVA